ncbi:MAG: response regulator transcription factor [Eubacteriales bacterium]|nr:response regulator transcription factor [Eubacteriales bacterium]
MQHKILIVDDDPNILELLRLYLQKEDFAVCSAMTGEAALQEFRAQNPEGILLDLMLPGKSGLDVLRELRRESDVPILILTAKGDTLDKVVGLELGADDYIEKPFEPKEVIARLKAVLRRARGELDPRGGEPAAERASSELLSLGSLLIDKRGFKVTVAGAEVELAPKELELLSFLASHPGRVFTRDQLLDSIWGLDYYGDNRTVDVHIRRLREKLDFHPHPDWELKTVWGVGYRLDLHQL